MFLNGFNFNDHVKYNDIADFKWKSNGIGTNFLIIPEGNISLINFKFSYSDYDITLTDPSNLPKESLINGFNLGLNITNYLQKILILIMVLSFVVSKLILNFIQRLYV